MEPNLEALPGDDIHELIWALLDEQISPDEFQRLESLLAADEGIRQLYVECVQLHLELQHWFRANQDSPQPGRPGLPLDSQALSGGSSLADLST